MVDDKVEITEAPMMRDEPRDSGVQMLKLVETALLAT
jgi:hypothetical protein